MIPESVQRYSGGTRLCCASVSLWQPQLLKHWLAVLWSITTRKLLLKERASLKRQHLKAAVCAFPCPSVESDCHPAITLLVEELPEAQCPCGCCLTLPFLSSFVAEHIAAIHPELPRPRSILSARRHRPGASGNNCLSVLEVLELAQDVVRESFQGKAYGWAFPLQLVFPVNLSISISPTPRQPIVDLT